MKSKNSFPRLAPTLKAAIVALTILQVSTSAMASYGNFDPSFQTSQTSVAAVPVSPLSLGSVVALNRDIILKGTHLSMGQELIVGDNGELSLVQADGESLETSANIRDLSEQDYTLLNLDLETGEIEAYNLPEDFKVAGKGGPRRKRGGVTNCYHVVKALVRKRVSLSGVAAYMAAPQLQRASWHRYGSYESAPNGSVCVFAAGGIVTPSGGHRYGHVGVKGAGGIANPTSGFHLKRPFLGCWNER